MSWLRRLSVAITIAALLSATALAQHHHALHQDGNASCAACSLSHGAGLPRPSFTVGPQLALLLSAPLAVRERIVPPQLPPLAFAPSTSPPSRS